MKTVITVIIVALVAWGIWAWVDKGDTALPGNQVENNGAANGEDNNPAGGIELATQEFTVNGSNFSFSPNKIEVFKGDKISITFNNTVGTHDLVVEGYNVRTKVLQAGQSETIEFIATETGTFEFYCSVGNHRAQGMKGTLVVKEVPNADQDN
jgi:plastocyanin